MFSALSLRRDHWLRSFEGEKGGDGCGLYCRGGVCTSSSWMLDSFIVFAFFSSKRLFLCEIF